MLTERLVCRVPSAVAIGAAKLPAHRIAFHKRSRKDGSAKADIVATDNPRDAVWGVVFEINDSDKSALDKAEGLGYAYEQKSVVVTSQSSVTYEAFTYYATDIDNGLRPYSWYLAIVIAGAEQHALPKDYVDLLLANSSSEDPDQKRDQSNRELICTNISDGKDAANAQTRHF